MPNTLRLSDAKRALLEMQLRGDILLAKADGGIPRRPTGGIAPLSFGQQQLWLLAQLMPESPVYSEPVTIHLPGLLNVDALERSLSDFVRLHEAWRTSFPVIDGEPVQMIHPATDLKLPLVDLRNLDEADREPIAFRLARDEVMRPFDLARGPLFRATLTRLADDDYRLFLALHHIIFDGVSIYQVFLPELHALYQAHSAGRRSPLPEMSIQYADYAYWQRDHLNENSLADQLAYWMKQLDGAPACLDLPTDHPRPPIQTYRGAMRPFALSKQLSDALKALSCNEGMTLYMTMVAAFDTLLYRYTGQDDLVVGTAVAGRNRPEVQGLTGFFLNTVVLRTSLAADPTFRELLARVREAVIGALDHQDVPFEYLVRALRPKRNPSYNPLFQALISLEPPLPALPSGWTLTQMDVETDTAKFDLHMELDDRPEGLIGRFEYCTDLFEPQTIARMAGHWQTLLEGIVADPSRRLSELPLITQMERRRALTECSAIQNTFSADHCLHELFEAQAYRTPNAVAVTFDGQRMTYRELNDRADRLARRLRQLGAGPDTPIALYFDRSPELVVAILATLKAGGCYLPLDPAYPAKRLAFMLEDSRARLVLTTAQLGERALELMPSTQTMLVDRDWPQEVEETTDNIVSGATAENLAYVIYTSGSTGKPKGVQITHRNVARLFSATDAWYRFNANDVWTLFHSYAFDFSVWEMWGALLYGGRLVIVPYDVSRSPSAFHALLCHEQVTVLNQTPSAFRQLIPADEASGRAHDLALRLVIFGGEMLDLESLRPWFDRYGDRHPQLVNMYGITETTVHVTYRPIVRADLDAAPGSVIGRPIPDLQVYVLDQHLEPVPVGVPGELYVGGAGLARGYLNRPELTAARFIRHPFSDEPGARVYKTGDLARVLSDGSLEYLGRLDDQVKIRGFRIELEEIQIALSQHPAVQDAVVIAREDTPGDKRLVAYLVPRLGHSLRTTEVRGYLRERLPEYMVPSAFVPLEALPLTTNGKLDRPALPAPGGLRPMGSEESIAAPILPLHRELIQIWEELLDVRPIGIEDDFFDLGGHSLLATRLLDRIQHVFGKRLPVAELFAGATIERLARVLGQDAAMVAVPRQPPTRAKARDVTPHRPFFFLHGDYRGDPLWCLNIARALAADHPLHLLPPGRLDGRVAPTLRDFAAAHLEALRAVQPEGPYLLGGWCNGALVAYEMAQQLFEEGQKVDLLVLMETAFVTPREQVAHSIVERAGTILGSSEARMLDWYVRSIHVSTYAARALSSLSYRLRTRSLGYLASRGSAELRRAASHLRRPAGASGHEHASGRASVRPREEYLEVFSWMADRYMPRSYPGTIALFWSREEPLDGKSRSTGWRIAAEASEVTVQVVPGTHMTCRTEHVHALAERLRTCLTAASQAGATGAVQLAATGRTRYA